MALIECNECGRQVSDTCETCPNCGANIQQQIYDSLSDEEKEAYDADANHLFGAYRWLCLCVTILCVIGAFGALVGVGGILGVILFVVIMICAFIGGKFTIMMFRR